MTHGLVAAGLLLAGPALLAQSAPASRLVFHRDVRPILAEHCFPCHGPDAAARQKDLRLDVREQAIARGAIVPFHPERSELVRRIHAEADRERMPPPKSQRVLSAEQRERLTRWIAEGAEVPAHWAFVPPTRPAVPAVRAAAWVRSPIDAFILARQEALGLAPSPEADRATLIRRLSLDLVGLPPSPDAVRAFTTDARPDAVEQLVDQLLASPHYGERMAMGWLDVVRFADTVGFHGDQGQNVFPYRDYVIDAFNRNQRFDQFTLEQLAGDLLPDPSVEQRVATGFLRLNMMTREGGAQPKEYLAKYTADRVRTVAGTWLGATLGCAECHDHKFDPFTTRDFYRLGAFFADLKQWGVYQDYPYTPNPDLPNWSNDHPFPPELVLESPALVQRIAHLRGQIAELAGSVAARVANDATLRAELTAWRAASRDFLARAPDGWETPRPEARAVEKPAAGKEPAPAPVPTVEDDGRVVFADKASPPVELIVRPHEPRVAALRLELLPHERHGGHVLRKGAEGSVLRLSATLQGKTGKPRAVAFRHADADAREPAWFNGYEIVGVKNGWRPRRERPGEPQRAVWLLDRPMVLGADERLVVKLDGSGAACVRLSVSPFAPADLLAPAWDEPARRALQAEPGADGDAAGHDIAARDRAAHDIAPLCALWLRSTAVDAAAFARLRALDTAVVACNRGHARTLVAEHLPQPMTSRVLRRGDWQDEGGDVVTPGLPQFLPLPVAFADRPLTRLDLARWLVAPENPLTARVFVNRLWKQLFGTALSAVVDDLGTQGEWPSHPELLDWLAVELRENGWDVKHLVRLLATSATYRQSAQLRAETLQSDPQNRLLCSQSPRRLEAELVRDNALAIAGLLDLEVGGPSAKPYQPPGYYQNLQFPDRDYVADVDERQFRRGLYMHWQRTFLHPMLAAFDAPAREECTAARVQSNTPQQALTLLNDPTFVEAARVLATRLLAADPDDARRLDALFARALARAPTAAEAASLRQYLAAQRARWQARPEDARQLVRIGLTPAPETVAPAELAAWTCVCRVVLNLHETLTRY